MGKRFSKDDVVLCFLHDISTCFVQKNDVFCITWGCSFRDGGSDSSVSDGLPVHLQFNIERVSVCLYMYTYIHVHTGIYIYMCVCV